MSPPSGDEGFAGYPRELSLAALGGAAVEWIGGYKRGYLCGATIGDYGDGRIVGGRRFYRGIYNHWDVPFLPAGGKRREECLGFLAGWKAGTAESKGRGRLSPSPLKDEWAETHVRAASKRFYFMLAAGIRRAEGGALTPRTPSADLRDVAALIRGAEVADLHQYYPVIAEGEPETERWRAKVRLSELLHLKDVTFPYRRRHSPRRLRYPR